LLGHGRESAENEAIDVSDDGGATRGDAALGEEIVESAESFVDGFGGLKVFGLAHEWGEQAEVVLSLLLGAGVIEAESSGRAGGELAATAF
jgi:hypothetical protein